MYDKLIKVMAQAARRAGEAILEVHESRELEVEYKADDSPLTRADKAAQEIIVRVLDGNYPEVSIVSEERRAAPFSERKLWPRFFLVDPLDGTKEFIKGNGEFTVNVALVAKNFPALGVVHVPVRDTTYWGGKDFGAFRQLGEFAPQALAPRQAPPADEALRVAVSRSHPSRELDDYLQTLGPVERIVAGSALKFCLLAEGDADLYARTTPTMEWDTAAGQAVLEGAGGSMQTWEGLPFVYNKESLENPGFVARGWSETAA